MVHLSQEMSSGNANNWVVPGLYALLLAVLIYGGYRHWELSQEFTDVTGELRGEIHSLEDTKAALEEQLASLRDDNQELATRLREKQQEVDKFNERIAEVTEGVDKITSTVQTDPELLRKYSRVYFLSENYVPESLVEIDEEYAYGDEPREIHKKVEPFLMDMLEDAKRDGIDLKAVSAYRSFQEQNKLNDSYTVVYGSGANQFSAEQGYSEHQLGTTVDFAMEGSDGNIDIFGSTEGFEWLEEHAHEYGFVLSYPKGNSYYQYEPWHWRFVGKELAEDLDDEGAHFYDWGQRKIDSYRSSFFER